MLLDVPVLLPNGKCPGDDRSSFAVPCVDLVPMQVAYHSKEIEGIASTFANPPVQVGANIGSVMDVIQARFPSA